MPVLQEIRWSEGRKEAFRDWAYQELNNCIADRAGLERRWQDYIIQWRGALPKGEKQFPWPGASNLEFPLTAIHFDPVYADLMQTMHAPQEYWTINALRPDRAAHAQPMTEFMKALDRSFLKMRRVNGRAFMDNNVLGTSIYKNHWLHERKSVQDYNEQGKIEKKVKVRSQPLIEHVPLQRFYVPADAWSLDPDEQGGARWKAEKLHFTKEQLAKRAQAESPFLPGFDKAALEVVLKFEQDKQDAIGETQRKLDAYSPTREQRIEVFEFWARFDTDGDDIEEDVVVLWHQPTGMILRALHNPMMHGRDPYHRDTYLPGFGIYGIGLAEQDEWAQLTATKLLNATIDNVMLANTRMWVTPLGSGHQPGEPIFPGKTWMVGPGEEVKALQAGEVYPSIFTLQQQVMGWAEMRTGVNELRQGSLAGMPSRTPATSMLSALREGNKRFDLVLSNKRDVHSEMGLRMLQNVGQWMRDDAYTWDAWTRNVLGAEDAALVKEVMSAPIHDLEASLGVSVTATSAAVNKEVEKQSMIGLMQVLAQVYPQLVQTAMLLTQTPPGSPIYDTAVAAYTGGVEMLRRLIEKFDIQNPDQYIPNLQALAGALQAQSMGANPAAPGLGMMNADVGAQMPTMIQ